MKEHNNKPIDKDLIWFGIRADTGRPILERVDNNRCGKCKGYGTYGNPLCGAVYTCSRCNGTGHNLLIEKILTFIKDTI